MIRGVLFDLDGTLFDRARSVVSCIESQHARHHDLLRAIPVDSYVSRFVELDARGYVAKDVVYRQLVKDCSLEETAARVLFDDFYTHYHRHALPFPGLHAVLEGLRDAGLKLGLITNGGTTHQQATIQALEIQTFFDAVLISESEGVRKPDPIIFRRALSRMGLAADEAVFVGDHPAVDVIGARTVGLHGIWKRDPYWGDCPEADAVIEDLGSLPEAIASLDQRGAAGGIRLQ